MEKDTEIRIDLILVNVSSSIAENDDEPSCVARLLDRLLSRVSCYDASDWLRHRNSSRCIEDVIRKDVERFMCTRDQILALASILLKSRAFFKDTNNITSKEKESSILVRLPRTIYNKPYIPRKNKCKDKNTDGDDNDDFSLSISHQFPFVAAAQRLRKGDDPCLKIGLDIVVREPLNTRLYDTWDDFLQVFQESFHREEWEIIVFATSSEARLQEFLIRWATKEAYTKAMGVGLGFDFASFLVKFDNELPESCNGQLCEYLKLEQSEDALSPIHVRGKVAVDGMAQAEMWDFYFGALGRDTWSLFCLAVGPTGPETDKKLQIRWTTVEQLISES